MHENKNKTYPNIQDTDKAVLREKLTFINVPVQKEKKQFLSVT